MENGDGMDNGAGLERQYASFRLSSVLTQSANSTIECFCAAPDMQKLYSINFHFSKLLFCPTENLSIVVFRIGVKYWCQLSSVN